MSQLTRRAIRAVFLELLEKKPLDKITVKDIVEHCGINRGTFYYYYQDIYALVDDVFQMEVRKVLDENQTYSSFENGFQQSIDFALQHKKILYHVYNSVSREELERYLNEVTEQFLRKFVETNYGDLNLPQESADLIVKCYRCALVGITLDWVGNGMQKDAEGFIKKMSSFFGGTLQQALERAAV